MSTGSSLADSVRSLDLTCARVFAAARWIAPLLFGLGSVARGVDANWDLLNYHLYNPFALLHGKLDFGSVLMIVGRWPQLFEPSRKGVLIVAAAGVVAGVAAGLKLCDPSVVESDERRGSNIRERIVAHRSSSSARRNAASIRSSITVNV